MMEALIRNSFVILLFSCQITLAQQLSITTTSSTGYMKDKKNAIYPAFVDGIQYQSWTEEGPKSYFQFAAQGGKAPYKWQLVNGTLPSGLKLTADGKIQGTATKEGTFNFTVKATDAGGAAATKKLVFQAESYRSKWMADAKFGIMVQWGSFTQPSLLTPEDRATFEKRITKFNADAWAEAIAAMGGKVLNFTAKSFDGSRQWPSTTPSKYEMKTKRNIVAELIAACHKRGIKFVAYFAPDNTSNKLFQETGADGSWGTLNKGLIKELVLMGVDGFWIDVTSSPEIHKDFDPKWFPWNEILPIMRANNPYVICANNPGLDQGGTVLRYPNTDVILYEGGMSPDASALKVAKPASVRKKVAIEVDNLLDNTWSWRTDPKLREPKSAETIINNIKANWAVGATYMLNYPVPTNGEIMPADYAAILKKIGAFVKGNQGWSAAPEASLSDTVEYTTAQTLSLRAKPGARIYYTLDGSAPSPQAKLYKGPVKLDKTTRVRAISVENGKPASKKADYVINIASTRSTPSARSARTLAAPAAAAVHEPDAREYYRGMKITIGPKPIRLHAVGRQFAEGNTSAHPILIKRFQDDYPILRTSITASKAKVAEDGFNYVNTPETILEAGKSYMIVSKENKKDQFYASDFKAPVETGDYRITGHAILSPVGDRDPVQDDKIGTLLNLRYEVVANAGNRNLAIGTTAFLKDNDGYSLGPARGTLYAENGIDGDKTTMAQAGGKYPWTFLVDLNKVNDGLKSVTVYFGEANYATELQVFSSVDGKNWEKIAEKSDNSDIKCVFPLKNLSARYFRVRALKPDARGQKGAQMGIMEFEVSQ
ncbi:hypothetical protein GCM10010967_06160 [Dyadobacter beijingensis]|uniref:alpha-L-fucosidase n=1 Tax=Dyadobacter beijingensis TaxID=365489 RepID=A0ABQ2HEA8_9BACT|nr:alpha-L-fucosidase [Dyadobacter beijingensis]GGM77319.1 hypothetical protein GCM10010967_06160 [Dyadobacter beijingensis]